MMVILHSKRPNKTDVGEEEGGGRLGVGGEVEGGERGGECFGYNKISCFALRVR